MTINNIFDFTPQHENEAHYYNWKKVFHSKDDVRELNRLLNKRPKRKKTYNNSRYFQKNFYKPRRRNEYNQRVVFKMSNRRSIKAHNRYLKVYMPQNNKEWVDQKPLLFGSCENQYEQNKVPLHFKCIISPENPNVDLPLLCDLFIKRIEYLTGYELYWKGAIHLDTDHPHAHICINGKDKNNKPVFFEKEIIKHTMREMLEDITTSMIGPRTKEEIEIAKKNMLYSLRWTEVDSELEVMKKNLYAKTLKPYQLERLKYLSKIQLATLTDSKYTLCPDWKETLIASGRYNTYLEVRSSSQLPVSLYEGGTITGRVCKVISFDKEESWNDAIVLEVDNKRVYVPVYQLHKENLLNKIVIVSGGDRSLSRQISDKNIRIVSKRKIEY